jgi:hypothetical protein
VWTYANYPLAVSLGMITSTIGMTGAAGGSNLP